MLSLKKKTLLMYDSTELIFSPMNESSTAGSRWALLEALVDVSSSRYGSVSRSSFSGAMDFQCRRSTLRAVRLTVDHCGSEEGQRQRCSRGFNPTSLGVKGEVPAAACVLSSR